MTGTDRRKEAAMEEMKKQNDELLKSVSGGETEPFYALCPKCGEPELAAKYDPHNIQGINMQMTIAYDKIETRRGSLIRGGGTVNDG